MVNQNLRESIVSQLIDSGLPAPAAKSISKALTDEPDDRRMLACLAIDIQKLAVDPAVLIDVTTEGPETRTSRAKIGRLLSKRAETEFALCSCPCGGHPTGETYATVMKIEKFIYLFREDDATVIGGAGIADEIEALRILGGDAGTVETKIYRPMKGWDRPITWITDRNIVDRALVTAGDENAAASIIAEMLGLPWAASVRHHMVVMFYPADNSFLDVGRPTCMCEVWEAPGIFVSAVENNGWGQTVNRTDATGIGAPERIHGPLEKLPPGVEVHARYIGFVELMEIDRELAAKEAERRWEIIARASADG